MDESMTAQPTAQSMRMQARSNLGSLVSKANVLETLAAQLSEELVGPQPCEPVDKKDQEAACDFVGEIRQAIITVRNHIDRTTRILTERKRDFRGGK